MGMWAGIKGTVKHAAGTTGTVTFKSGARILQIIAAGAGTVTIPDGAGSTVNITVTAATAPFTLQNNHEAMVMQGTGGQLNIVFGAGITSYYIQYIDPAGAS